MHYVIENGTLRQAPRGSEINSADFVELVDAQRYKVSADKQHNKFVIDFGFHEEMRSQIICNDRGEMLHALALVRQALGK